MRLIVTAVLLALAWSHTRAAEVTEVLRNYIIDQASTHGRLVLPVRLNGAKASPTTVFAADRNGIDVDAQGGRMTIPWKLVDEAALYDMFDPLWSKAPADVHGAYLRLAIKRDMANGATFKNMLTSLWEKDSASAKEIEAALHSAKDGALATKESALATAATPSKETPFDKDAYARLALAADPQSLALALGPDYETVHSAGSESLPTAPAAVTKLSGKIGRNGQGFPYQLGNPTPDAGNYWTTQGQVLYVPDKSSDLGADRVDVASYGHHCLNLKPEPAWWGGAHPEPALLQNAWLASSGGKLGQPIAIERSYAAFSENGFMIFKSGLLGAAAVNNVTTYPYFVFPKQKVPTALSLTSKNEFALVTIWDIQDCKGQVAVLALGCTDKGRTAFGLPSWGVIDQIKLLGYVDLPITMPTDISATSCAGWGAPVKSTEYKLDDPNDRRARFESDEIARSGFAVVLSRKENKAVFIDLQPLISGVRETCFTTQSNADKTHNAGLGPTVWPFAFDVDARMKPRLLGTLELSNPVAVRVSPWKQHDNHRVVAVIATVDGDLHIYDVNGLAGEGAHSFADVKPLSVARVGRNPCAIAYQRYADPYRKATQGTGVEGQYSMNNVFLVCCRGDREIDWVEAGARPEVYRRFKDSRLADPVCCQQTRTNSDDGAYIVTIGDFKNRKLLNYRVGEAHIDRKAVPISDGKSEIEFMGAMDLPGRVFRISSDNVP
jgi:hypothetical protein